MTGSRRFSSSSSHRQRGLHRPGAPSDRPTIPGSASCTGLGLERGLGELFSHLIPDFLTLLTQRQHLQTWAPSSEADLLALHQWQKPGILKVGTGRKDQVSVVVCIKDIPHAVERPIRTGRAGHHLMEYCSRWLHRHRLDSSSNEGVAAAPQPHPRGCSSVRRVATRSLLAKRGADGSGRVGRRGRPGITGHGLTAKS